MNDLEFRQQHLDTKSASFCAAKWYNATIWLGSGQTTSCHHPPAHHVTEKEVIINPAALHNTKQKRDDRAKMITTPILMILVFSLIVLFKTGYLTLYPKPTPWGVTFFILHIVVFLKLLQMILIDYMYLGV